MMPRRAAERGHLVASSAACAGGRSRSHYGSPAAAHAVHRAQDEMTTTTTTNERRYVTWRLPDRQFSKVHLQRDPEQTICGRTLPRATGSPQPPIPDAAMCQECAASEA